MAVTRREIRSEIPDTACLCSRCYSQIATFKLVLYIHGRKQNSIRVLARCHRCAMNAAKYYKLTVKYPK